MSDIKDLKSIIIDYLNKNNYIGLYYINYYTKLITCTCYLNKDLFYRNKCHLQGPLFCYPLKSIDFLKEYKINQEEPMRIDEILKIWLMYNSKKGFKSLNHMSPCKCLLNDDEKTLFGCYYQDPHNCEII